MSINGNQTDYLEDKKIVEVRLVLWRSSASPPAAASENSESDATRSGEHIMAVESYNAVQYKASMPRTEWGDNIDFAAEF
ncbi:hypothetical protein C2857_004388 [Epichloe festucae Fl1]|uniref:Uncharacterized protein n=1 Tax=Epichloe festucae (strain Fl1) TaxID=877507 RepID=A0A7U3Q3N1_EPIFF|nr:hypothetical protein C2857_004388 [Epichloe festucae Fl1]